MSLTGAIGPLGVLKPPSTTTGPIGPNGVLSPNANGTTTAGTVPLTSTSGSKLNLNTQGWWMFAGITTGILLGNTPVAPFTFGILTLALIYQTSQLLQHK